MRILYIVSRPLEINTSSSIRNLGTIKGLLETGHDVTLVTMKPDASHRAYDASLNITGLKTLYLEADGIQKAAQLGNKNILFKRLKPFISKFLKKNELYDSYKGITKHIGEVELKWYDLIISSSDPKSSHLFAGKVIEKSKCTLPWIQIWGDPFVGDITRKNIKITEKVAREESRLLKEADRVIYVSHPTLIEQKKRYQDYASKMFYVPSPYLNKVIYNIKKPYDVSQMIMVYCGDYNSDVRNIIPLYKAAKKTGARLIICGISDLKLDETDNIKIYSRISYDRVKEFERNADVLVHLSNLYGSQIPGKIYQYSGTNKSILFILDGDKESLARAFRKYDRYIFQENNEREIIKFINEFVKDRANTNYLPVEDFSPRTVAGKILENM